MFIFRYYKYFSVILMNSVQCCNLSEIDWRDGFFLTFVISLSPIQVLDHAEMNLDYCADRITDRVGVLKTKKCWPNIMVSNFQIIVLHWSNCSSRLQALYTDTSSKCVRIIRFIVLHLCVEIRSKVPTLVNTLNEGIKKTKMIPSKLNGKLFSSKKCVMWKCFLKK